MPVDITEHLTAIFNFIYSIYNFLNEIKFTAFEFEFTLLGIFLSLIFLVILIKFMKFGFEEGADSSIKYHRAENKEKRKSGDK